jgi:hypothetical protein
MILSQKYPTQIRAGGVAQVVESLPGKCEALNSNLSTTPSQKKYGKILILEEAGGKLCIAIIFVNLFIT